METIKINNRLYLINDFTQIEVKVICPQKNIQKMLLKTNSKFISKKEIVLNYNHNGGQIFEVTILARFMNVKTYLDLDMIYNSENFNHYEDMLKINKNYTSNCYTNLISSLYIFGNVFLKSNKEDTYTRYYRKDGHSILRPNTDFTNLGEKRYIRTGKGWLSNKAY